MYIAILYYYNDRFGQYLGISFPIVFNRYNSNIPMCDYRFIFVLLKVAFIWRHCCSVRPIYCYRVKRRYIILNTKHSCLELCKFIKIIVHCWWLNNFWSVFCNHIVSYLKILRTILLYLVRTKHYCLLKLKIKIYYTIVKSI